MKNIKLNACLIGIMLVCIIFLRTPTIGATQPPVADAGGPYSDYECETIFFDGSHSTTYDGSLQYRWDFNGDGTWDTAWDSNPFGEHTWYDDYQGTAILQVTDGTYTSTATAAVTIINSNPMILNITGPVSPVQVGTEVPITVTFMDGDPRSHLSFDTYVAIFSWGDGLQSSYNLPNGTQVVTGVHVYSQAGVYTVTITITDDNGGSATGTYQFVVVYEPNVQPCNGFITGGGWIVTPPGSYRPNLSITGTANFGLNCKYKKGHQTPDGQTEFNFQEANLNFHSQSYDWLTVAGSVAQYKGTGTINGAGSYGFIITVTDGQPDTFRIQIWDKTTGTVIFDNNANTPLSGGQIVIHRA